jgi:N-acetylneuraminic acid mutarotase
VAQPALPAGAVPRRAVFGLFDADGWTWAGLKAAFWFLVFIFTLGYIPNLAYYFTVSDTVQVGYNAISPINWCPAGNEDLPCPAPAGAVVPWQPAPPELALPEPVTGATALQSGAHLYVVGGSTGAGATADVSATEVAEDGNITAWASGPALPEPRTAAVGLSLAGLPYIVGGLDASGAPTTSVFVGSVEEGVVTGWTLANGEGGTPDLTLPVAVSDAAGVGTAGGLYLFGGTTADGVTDQVLRAATDGSGTLIGWQAIGELPLPEPRTGATAVAVGDFIYVLGGTGRAGPTSTIYRLSTEEGVPARDEQDVLIGWASAPADQQLPGPRTQAATFTANGAMYVIGGLGGDDAATTTTWWAVPDGTTGDIPEWQRLDQTELPEARADHGIASIGSFVYLVGGQGADGAALASATRANLSPQPPFFQLGILGATIPALSIKGEIGQQLGYLNAMGVGMVNFVILVIIGYAMSHRQGTLRVLERLTRGRIQAPREDEFVPGP